ncbi:hypothetical protein FS837_003656 [Tulasnella sp. UAMH 9824]|nr:hypothetical protein FS837_003656 [Tulasnella sp. UAMH 9824]
MKLKLSVSGVSRTWQNLAVEFLFNSIRIHDMKQIPLLWRAFEGDAKRRGERASKEIIAQPGSAPWWIRELWIDYREINLDDPPDSTEFQLADLLKICPNIIKYRRLGSWRQSRFPPRWRDDVVLKQLLRLPDDRGDKTHAELHGVQDNEDPGYAHELQGSDLDIPDTGRRIELCFAFDGEPCLGPFSNPPIPRPRTLTLPCISSLELRSLGLFMIGKPVTYNTIQLPNLVHLSLGGRDSFLCATTRLILPSLRSVTLDSSSMGPLGESRLESFLEKHGFALEELTILETLYSKYLERLNQLCPALQTFRTHYSELPRSTVSTVRHVGLYGLKYAGPYSQSEQSLIFGILKAFPAVLTIQDLSWRSSVIRRRAYTTSTYP